MANIELREAFAARQIARGRWAKVKLNRRDVFFDGVLVARIGNKPNSRLQFIRNFGSDLQKQISEAVSQKLGRPVQDNMPPKRLEIEDTELDGGEPGDEGEDAKENKATGKGNRKGK